MLAERFDVTTLGRKAGVQSLAASEGRATRPTRSPDLRPDRPARVSKRLGATGPLVADRLLERDVQLIVLGTGHRHYQELLESLDHRFPGKVWAHIGFSEDLAHQIEAGADIFLMPSLFEPCGLTQLYSLAHGTLPIVRATGGLADTVIDATPEHLADGTANGFVFRDETPDALWSAIQRRPGPMGRPLPNRMRRNPPAAASPVE